MIQIFGHNELGFLTKFISRSCDPEFIVKQLFNGLGVKCCWYGVYSLSTVSFTGTKTLMWMKLNVVFGVQCIEPIASVGGSVEINEALGTFGRIHFLHAVIIMKAFL